ncbi:hypothetical protein MAR_007366 [Mya arenaria]|uniref:Uncharacterized protein n=1 Tax=Mya arenaria TaxID=6604 RepID=A0ABY7DIQ4_MYAAR|nr:hypothetical protein MAR_007366 [Mya arenaria]
MYNCACVFEYCEFSRQRLYGDQSSSAQCQNFNSLVTPINLKISKFQYINTAYVCEINGDKEVALEDTRTD